MADPRARLQVHISLQEAQDSLEAAYNIAVGADVFTVGSLDRLQSMLRAVQDLRDELGIKTGRPQAR